MRRTNSTQLPHCGRTPSAWKTRPGVTGSAGLAIRSRSAAIRSAALDKTLQEQRITGLIVGR
jgi:hypothetical protein